MSRIYAFEAAPAAARILRERFVEAPMEVVELALSDCSGETTFYVSGPTAGTNSLYPGKSTTGLPVRSQKLDDWATESLDPVADPVAMVKSDVEGHDFRVLRGASKILSRGLVEIWQFEYNWRWIYAGSSLFAVFDLLDTLPYRLGRLYNGGIEFYSSWHPELDRFFETQYVLVREDSPLMGFGREASFTPSNVAT